MQKWKTFGVTAFMCLMISVPSFGADVAKIGIVDVQKVLLTSSVGKMVKAQMNKKFREIQSVLNEKKEEIQNLRENFEREALVMSNEKKEEREREIRIKINDIKELQQKYENDMKLLNEKAVKRVRTDILQLVNEIGKKEGFLLIISDEVVLYSPTSIDISDQVIQAYNAYAAEDISQFDIEKLE
jgi:outer membrane protein